MAMMVITSERVRLAVRDIVFSPEWVGFNLLVRSVWAGYYREVSPKLEVKVPREFRVTLNLSGSGLSNSAGIQCRTYPTSSLS